LSKTGKRILLVDDEENARTALARILARDGYEITSAGNGLEALEQLKISSFDLVVTDINMPEMNGMSFLRELNSLYPGINVIMITAYGEVESYIEAMSLGAFEYINKPVRIDEVKKIIKKVFRET
jgi:two-component system, response regulator, stage 0 sporulation protein F